MARQASVRFGRLVDGDWSEVTASVNRAAAFETSVSKELFQVSKTKPKRKTDIMTNKRCQLCRGTLEVRLAPPPPKQTQLGFGVTIRRGRDRDHYWCTYCRKPDPRPVDQRDLVTARQAHEAQWIEPTPRRKATRPAQNLPEQLRELADLHRAGVLTDAEFAAAKRKLLGT